MSARLQNIAPVAQPLAAGIPPDWASEWGEDRYGVFVGFTIGAVTQRMRWIPPGRFLMGSLPTEQGRFDNESPRHEVVICKGFWLFDTPCTQALWQEVMNANPSRFQSPDRPVETVSWNDAQDFLLRIEKRIPTLGLSLPSEAQWEYACRAGVQTSTYVGEVEILGTNNAPGLDPIAWYGGNSGHEFDLDNGEQSSNWPQKQYDHKVAGTRLVRLKKRNAWGLYDMLGHVLEWCADGLRDYRSEAITDPLGPIKDAAERALRGGSWHYYAQNVRSAYRLANDPGLRNFNVGFRCARVQE
jgi:formylglycine-generating enzyme required for sulfatase activity